MTDLPNTAVGVLKLMPSKAKEIGQFSYQIIKAVQTGEANALEVLVMLRSLEAVSELVREEIQPNINAEADRFNEKVIERYGAKIEKCELGTKYNYLKTGDIEYEQLHAEAETAKRRLKEREDFLKSLTQPMQLVNTDTGETYQVHPPMKTSKTGVKVFLR